jgi:hypothetical protein
MKKPPLAGGRHKNPRIPDKQVRNDYNLNVGRRIALYHKMQAASKRFGIRAQFSALILFDEHRQHCVTGTEPIQDWR